MKHKIYVGTYTGTGSEGVYSFEMEDGKMSDASLFYKMKNPKYISKDENRIVAAGDYDNGSGITLLDEQGNCLDQKTFEQRTSCYVNLNEHQVVTANYHEGTFSVLSTLEDQIRLVEKKLLADGAGCHQVLRWKSNYLVPSLFLDRIVIFDAQFNQLDSIRFDKGTGPRHGVFSKDGEYLYLVSELSNELYVIHTGDWQVVTSICVLENDEKHVRGGAAIRMNEDETKLYVSTRGKDVISVINLQDHTPTLEQVVSCGGKQPRDFILVDGYLVCANRYSNEVVSYKIEEDGKIGKEINRIQIQEPVSLTY